MSKNAPTELIQETLRGLSPPIVAFGIGGSVGGARVDRYSDLDYFVLIPSRGFYETVQSIVDELRWPDEVVVDAGPTWRIGFGFQYSVYLRSQVPVDIFFNCPGSLDPNPMRQDTKLLYDPTGAYSNLLDKASLVIPKSVIFDHLLRLHKLRQAALRHAGLAFWYNLSQLHLLTLRLRSWEDDPASIGNTKLFLQGSFRESSPGPSPWTRETCLATLLPDFVRLVDLSRSTLRSVLGSETCQRTQPLEDEIVSQTRNLLLSARS